MCPVCKVNQKNIVKSGFFSKNASTNRRVQRFRCKSCRIRFSTQTGSLTYRERKPQFTNKVMALLMEGMSQRGCARSLGITQKTVQNKLRRLGVKAKELLHTSTAIRNAENPVKNVIFDEMETSEHTKCKPISILVVVEEDTRMILNAEVASMPAKGKLAVVSRKKYGPRKDERDRTLGKVLESLKEKFQNLKTIKSDKCPRYPSHVVRVFGDTLKHIKFKGRRGCVVGQGELKRGGFDPLFDLNHTCAMFRDRVKRLSRRTWCTTKKKEYLQYIIHLYAWWHNQLLRGGVGLSIMME